MSYKEKFESWLGDKYFEEFWDELKGIQGDETEVQDRFYKDLDFGTGGLRGIIGAGTNRMNVCTVRKATQGLANFINKEKEAKKSVAIAYDSRRMSAEFALEAALCLCANGIRAYLFDNLRPTPELSFAVRNLKCTAGIVITASHNPAEYNGYKVYWEDGAQITAPKDKQIISEVNAVVDYNSVKTMHESDAKAQGLLTYVGEEIDSRYIEEVKKLILNQEIIQKMADKIKIVYTPLHGTGNILVRRILSELGFQNVYVVKEQELPDGDFSTVLSPNPEDPKAFELALKLADEVDADLVLATDPDADRLGVYAKDNNTGKYIPFTGNMSGLLIAEYQLSQKQSKGILPENGALVKTIVSSEMAKEMAEFYHVHLIEVLTGFKYIGEQIKWFEEQGNYQYLFGYEESYGCLLGTYARDKDAVSAVAGLCEAAAFYQQQGETLWDQMQNIYKKYGYYKEELLSVTLKGVEGRKKIQDILQKLREEPPAMLGDSRVIAFRDYQEGIRHDLLKKTESVLELPKSNVLYYELENRSWCCVRPSGTEPKVKFYFGVKASDMQKAEEKIEALRRAAQRIIE